MEVKQIFGKPSVVLWVEKLEETSKVIYYSEADVTFSCSMDFAAFPYDEQLCSFKITNYDLLPAEQFIMTNLIADFDDTFDAFSPTDNNHDYQVLLQSFNL